MFVDAHAKGAAAIREAAGVAVGLTLAMADDQATPSPEPAVPLTMMGYEFWPEALGATIRRAAAVTGVPVLVTENGVATDDDTRRIEFVRRALDSLLLG